MNNETNETCSIIGLTHNQRQFINDYKWWVQMANVLVGFVGVILNFITITVVTSSKSTAAPSIFSSTSAVSTLWSSFFNRLLVCLALFDTLYISCEISLVFLLWDGDGFVQQHILIYIVKPAREIFMYSSIYMTVVLAIDRYRRVLHPIWYRNTEIEVAHKLNKLLFIISLAVLLFSVCFCFPKFFELYIKCSDVHREDTTQPMAVPSNENKCTNYTHEAVDFREHHLYTLLYENIAKFILTLFIPLIALAHLNRRIIQKLRMDNISNEKTKILFSIIILFSLCHSLRVVLDIEEIYYQAQPDCKKGLGFDVSRIWRKYALPFEHTLTIMNSTSNFFIYVFLDEKFRQSLRRRFTSKRDQANVNNSETIEMMTIYGEVV